MTTSSAIHTVAQPAHATQPPLRAAEQRWLSGASRCSRATCRPLAILGRRELRAPAAKFAIVAIGESTCCRSARFLAVCRRFVAAALLQALAALRRGVVASPVSRARRSASAARCFSMRRAFQRPSREQGTASPASAPPRSCSGGSGVREQRCIIWIGVVAA